MLLFKNFDNYFTPKKNITYQRYRFFSYNQNDGQSIDSYATELRTRADHCDFGDLKDSLIRDKIIIGIRDSKTQERLLRESVLSLDKALQICRASKEVKVQIQEIQGASGGITNTKVNFVNSKHKYRPQESSAHRPKSTMSRRKTTPASGHKNRCNQCGRLHNKDKSKCPAVNQRCHNCGMLGYFAVVCKNNRKVRHVKAELSHSDYSNESSETEDSEEEFYVGSIVIDNSTTDVSNVTQEYIVEQSNTNSEGQQDTDKSIDESIVDVKSDNKEEKLYDEPELVCKEDKQEEKAEVNQNEHITERVNAGDNQKEMAQKMIMVKIQQKRLKNFSYLQ